jgi:hypothetical protein
MSHAVAQIGIERGPASEVVSKLDDHSVLTFHKILIPGRVIDRDNKQSERIGLIHRRIRLLSYGLWS